MKLNTRQRKFNDVGFNETITLTDKKDIETYKNAGFEVAEDIETPKKRIKHKKI